MITPAGDKLKHFMGFSDGEADINDVFSGVGSTSQSTGSGLNDITFQGTYKRYYRCNLLR